MAECEVLPGPPVVRLPLTRGAPVRRTIGRTDPDGDAPFPSQWSARVIVGRPGRSGQEIECEIEDGRIVMVIPAGVADGLSARDLWQVIVSPSDDSGDDWAVVTGDFYRADGVCDV